MVFTPQNPYSEPQTTVSEKPYPETGAEKNRIQKTLSRKPGPKKPYPKNRTQKVGTKKTGSEKGGFWGWFLRRSDTEYGFWYTDI